MRDAGEVDFTVERHHPGGGAIEGIVEAIGEDRGVVAFPVAIAILDHADFLRIFGEIGERPFLVGVFFEHLQASGGGGELIVVGDPWVAAVVLHAAFEAVGLRDVEAVLVVEGDGRGILHIRLAGEKFRHHALGSLDRGEDGLLLVLGRDRNRVRGAFGLAGILVGKRRRGQDGEKSDGGYTQKVAGEIGISKTHGRTVFVKRVEIRPKKPSSCTR